MMTEEEAIIFNFALVFKFMHKEMSFNDWYDLRCSLDEYWNKHDRR